MVCVDTPANSNGAVGIGEPGGARTKMGVQVYSGHCSVGISPGYISFWLKKDNSPTGNGVMKIYNSSGTVQATSTNTIDWSTLTTGFTEQQFTFSGTYEIAANDIIAVEGGTTVDPNKVTMDAGEPDESMNQNLAQYVSGSWSTTTSRNTRCKFETATPASSDVLLPPPVAWI